MAKKSTGKPTGSGFAGQGSKWFVRRQVYLRAGQQSQYVDLSPTLQMGVAAGFGAIVLLLGVASYAALSGGGSGENDAALLSQLDSTEQALADVQRERDEAREDASRVADLEAALAEAEAAAADAQPQSETAMSAELEQTRGQLNELHVELSESKADYAALQARFEAETSLPAGDGENKPAEEASSLHGQLESAFEEIALLEQERSTAASKISALSEENERNTSLLQAATEEIERLQMGAESANVGSGGNAAESQETVERLELQLEEATVARQDLEQQVADLRADLEQAGASSDGDAAAGAEVDMEKAELVTNLEELKEELAAATEKNAAEAGDAATGDLDAEEEEALRQRVAVAESEIERLILTGLRKDEGQESSAQGGDQDAGETERLRSELLAAKADIIKLTADVKAAKRRLSEQSGTQTGDASRGDNSEKLEQQLASTRSRIQQLNKALADAKLREVAVDLALINVVPSPSPPAPR